MSDANLTKREIVVKIYEKTSLPQKDIQHSVQGTLDTIVEALAAGRSVELRNFGVFEVTRRRARRGRNPNVPGALVEIPERAVIRFKPGKELRRRIKAIDLSTLPYAAAANGQEDEAEDEGGAEVSPPTSGHGA